MVRPYVGADPAVTPAVNSLLPTLSGESGKKTRCHLRGKILEHANWPGNETIAEVAQRKVECPEVPFRHHLNEPAGSQELGLHYRRKVSDAGARKQGSCKPVIFVNCQIWLERNRCPVFGIRVNKIPGVLWPPEREGEKPVTEEFLGCSWGLVLLQVFRAGYELMAIGQDPQRYQRRILQLAHAKSEIDTFCDLVHDSLCYENLNVNIRVFPQESDDNRRQKRVGDTRRSGQPEIPRHLQQMIGGDVVDGFTNLRAATGVIVAMPISKNVEMNSTSSTTR